MNEVITNQNTVWHEATVNRLDRERLNGHRSCILWFTGLSGSGKSTMSHAVEHELYKQGVRTFVLDGDNVRRGLCKDLGFSDSDRTENIRRIGEVSRLMMQAGVITLSAFISPFVKDRQLVRELVGPDEFIEIYCDAPLDICETRDVKGLYKRARLGLIPEFTGISSPYEKPVDPEITLHTGTLTVDDCAQSVIEYLNHHGYLKFR
jgi:adenylylsulfate kinase